MANQWQSDCDAGTVVWEEGAGREPGPFPNRLVSMSIDQRAAVSAGVMP
jgi:hypothetical protein